MLSKRMAVTHVDSTRQLKALQPAVPTLTMNRELLNGTAPITNHDISSLYFVVGLTCVGIALGFIGLIKRSFFPTFTVLHGTAL